MDYKKFPNPEGEEKKCWKCKEPKEGCECCKCSGDCYTCIRKFEEAEWAYLQGYKSWFDD